jgi:hypothetical protein
MNRGNARMAEKPSPSTPAFSHSRIRPSTDQMTRENVFFSGMAIPVTVQRYGLFSVIWNKHHLTVFYLFFD